MTTACLFRILADYFHVGGADVMVKMNGINSFNKEKGQDKVRQWHEAFQF